MHTRILFTIALLAAACGRAPEALETKASALVQTFNSPWPSTTQVDVYIGTYGPTGAQLVLWKRKSDNLCVQQNVPVDGGNNWSVDVTVNASAMDDILWVSDDANPIYASCTSGGTALGTAHTNGHQIVLNGLAGNDTFYIRGAAWVTAYGGDGNDYLYSYIANVVLHGGNNDDVLTIEHSNAFGTAMYGEDGNDCLLSLAPATEPHILRFCGNGVDRYSKPATGDEYNCETPQVGCQGF